MVGATFFIENKQLLVLQLTIFYFFKVR